jgi:hypothetical protein
MFPPQGVSQQSQPLDGPPPSPQSMGSGPTGAPTQFSLQAIAPGSVPAQQMPPEVITAIVSAAQKISTMIDSFIQVTPDLQQDWGLLKDQLQTVLAKLMTQGAGAMSPTATGPQFPGGGMDRGISGAGTI